MKWKERARNELCDPYRSKVLDLPSSDKRFIAAVNTIRNCIAHRSKRASNEMNEALARLQKRDQKLKRAQRRITPSGVGAYLYADCGGERRVEVYHKRLEEVAEALRV